MKLKVLAAIIAGLALAGCGGGGGDDNGTTGFNTPSGSSGTSGTAGSGNSSAGNTSTSSAPISNSGTEYLTQTAQAGQRQEQLSQVTAQKTNNPEVRQLAQELTADVNVINQQVTQVSQTNNITINNNVNAEQQTQINNFNTLSGNELDRTYVTGLVESWRNLLASTLIQARQGADIQVRQTATANLLVIEQRLALAEELLVKLIPTEYLVQAYQTGLLEIQLSQLALQKSTNAQVREYAQRMIDDHTQINARVTALAGQKNVTLTNELSVEKQAKVTVLSSYSDADFDKAYMDRNIHTHTKSVSLTTVVAQSSTDVEIKALAAESLPTLQAHLQSAQSINTAVQASQVYQLSQSLVTEIQIAQFVQARTNNVRIKALAQQILTENQNAYTQLAQLSQETNVTIALTVEPARIQTVQQLRTTTEANADRQALSLISEQTSQSLQVAQSVQASNDTRVSNIASTRVSVLQARSTSVSQVANGGTATPATRATPATPAASASTGTGAEATVTANTGTGTASATSTGGTGAGATAAEGTDEDE